MKRYAIFGGQSYYARGGMNDLVGLEDTIEEARARVAVVLTEQKYIEDANHISSSAVNWWQIVDLTTLQMIEKSKEEAHGADDYCVHWYNIEMHDGKAVSTHLLLDEYSERKAP